MQRHLSLFIVGLFFCISFFGVCLVLRADHEMPMTGDCLHLIDRSLVCPLGFGERFSAWKDALVVQPVKFVALFTGLVSIAAVLLLRFFDCARVPPKHAARRRGFLQALLPFVRLFSRGILHPKIFEVIG